MRLNRKTKKLNKLLLEIIEVSKEFEKKFFVAGGFALDIEVGRLTRNHDDLDLHPLEKNITWWKKWFRKKGFKIDYNPEIKDKTKAFVAYSPDDEFYVDMYGVKVGRKGKLFSAESGKRHDWAGTTWQGTVKTKDWQGRKVNILHHEGILWLKKKTVKKQSSKLRKKDIHDLKLFEKAQ